MKFYFSGIRSSEELEWLAAAGTDRVLVDQFDLANLPVEWGGEVLVDSGAYRYFKAKQNGQRALARNMGQRMTGAGYEAFIRREIARRRHLVGAFSLDAIGDPETTHKRWIGAR